MGIMDLINRAKTSLNKYAGDTAFLNAAAAACALVVAADGLIEENEKDAALKGLMSNQMLSSSFSPSEIEEALGNAIVNAGTRAGKMTLTRALESMVARSPDQRQDILLIAADTGDAGGLSESEIAVLHTIGKALNVDTAKLLG